MRRRLVICLGTLCGLCFIAPAIAILCLDNIVDRLTSLSESHRMQWLRAELVGAGIRIERDLLQSADRRPLGGDLPGLPVIQSRIISLEVDCYGHQT